MHHDVLSMCALLLVHSVGFEHAVHVCIHMRTHIIHTYSISQSSTIRMAYAFFLHVFIVSCCRAKSNGGIHYTTWGISRRSSGAPIWVFGADDGPLHPQVALLRIP